VGQQHRGRATRLAGATLRYCRATMRRPKCPEYSTDERHFRWPVLAKADEMEAREGSVSLRDLGWDTVAPAPP
jgi:hypothetical protein